MDIITIKRYANRKLYNTETSKYVTLPQIAELVKEGRVIQVIDNATKNEITDRVLLQALVQSEQEQELSLETRSVIRITEVLERVIKSKSGTISGYIQELEQRLG